MQQLKGKKWGMSGTLATYWLLYKSGIKEEPPKFFSEMKFVVENPTKNLFDALLNKDIDVFIVSHKIVDMALNNDAKYNKAIKALTCAEYDHNMIFSAKKSVPQADMDKIKAAFLNAHKDKAFQSFWFLFKAINGRFVDFDPAALATTQQIVNVATKNHWYEIEKKFITNKGMKK
jgi:ABC-type phosphate/phosphonate transport system substrate-binding protein